MEAHFAGSSSSLTQVSRCTGSGAQYISLQHPTQAGSLRRHPDQTAPEAGNPLAKPSLVSWSVCRSQCQRSMWRVLGRGVVAKAVEKKNSCTSDVEATELRLARLRDSVPTPMHQEPAAVAELQGRIDELVESKR